MGRTQRQAMDHPIKRLFEVKNMQIEFLRDRARAQVGQRLDSTKSLVVSATSIGPAAIPFGVLVVFDDSDAFLCKLPTAKTHLEKPLGITLHQLHCENYQPKSSIAAMRKGRIWVEVDKVEAPGDAVYIKLAEDGTASFSGIKTGNTLLKGAIFLEKSEGGKVPIEVNFFGGVA
jgi:hypothetical protein